MSVNCGSLQPDHGAHVAAQHGFTRSPSWHAFSRKVLADTPFCVACRSKDCLQVHHLWPFHFVHAAGRGDLELDRRNVNPYCEASSREHHLLLGHSGNFQSFTSPDDLPRVIKQFGMLTAEQIRISPSYRELELKRAKPLREWGVIELRNLKGLLDQRFPIFKGSKS